MTIEKAIEILKDEERGVLKKIYPELDIALLLGIEALKRIKKSRGDASRYYIGYLPGETKEQKDIEI